MRVVCARPVCLGFCLALAVLFLPGPASAASKAGSPAAVASAEHRNGTSIAIRKIVAAPDAILLDAVIRNDGAKAVRLNVRDAARLTDDRGRAYPLQPPVGNADLVVSPGSVLETTLRFRGQLDSAVSALTLHTNREPTGSATDPKTEFPVLAIDLPVPTERRSYSLAEPAPEGAAPAPRSAPAPAADAAGNADAAASEVAGLRDALGARTTERGMVVTLAGDVLFDYDKAEIQPQAEPVLRKLAELIRTTAPHTVIVEGHTDSRGEERYNDDLSLKRAFAVSIWLEKVAGVTAPAIDKTGYGERRPVDWNTHRDGTDNPEGREKNRRVEVVLVVEGVRTADR